ncbi:MAG: hypothetical protein IJI25_00145 [Eubacterium sp.]|nr:hypothetical protein [Eubacterium sp.]
MSHKKKADCSSLHPNPYDEFSQPEVGPSYRIISEYESRYLDAMKHGRYYYFYYKNEPILVEKMYPEGYMILAVL